MLWLLLAACDDPLPPLPEDPPFAMPVTLAPGVTWPLPARAPWPGDWPTATPEEAGLDPAALAALDAWVFRDDVGKALHTDALVLVKGGKLVHERYAHGTTADTPLLTWSVSKSLVNTLIGTAVLAGKVDVNAKASTYLPAMDTPGVRDVRVTDLLRMSSGLEWSETYETSPVYSSVMQMLYTRGRGDMAGFAASRGLRHAPGTVWSYSSGNSNVLMAILAATMTPQEYASYPWTAVFEPLGMTSPVFERDGAGTFVGSSYWYASARDTARWAMLYVDDGVWNGERVLPEGWVRYTTTLAPAYLLTPDSVALREDNPGAHWYVNVGDPSRGIPPPFPDAPADLFGAQGHWGKRVWVLPSDDLIAVRFGDDRAHPCGLDETGDCEPDPEKVWNDQRFLTLLDACVTR